MIKRGSSRLRIPEPNIRVLNSTSASGCVQDRLDDLLIAGATAEIPFQTVPDLLFGRLGILLQQRNGRHDHSGRAVAALQSVFLPKGILHRMQLFTLRQPFDGCHLSAVRLDRQAGAGLEGAAFHVHRAGSALAGVATDVGARQTEFFAKKMDQEDPRLHLAFVSRPVHRNRDFHAFLRSAFAPTDPTEIEPCFAASFWLMVLKPRRRIKRFGGCPAPDPTRFARSCGSSLGVPLRLSNEPDSLGACIGSRNRDRSARLM